jgi:hypothetical protein
MGAPQERPGGIDYFTGLGGLTAIGILAYAVLRLSYWKFYSHFGVTPEEVGLGYIEILTRSAPLLVCAMAVVGLITWFFAGKLFEMQGRERVTVVAVAASLLFLVALFAGPIRASKLATVVEHGIPVHSRSFFELVPIQVDYVTLTADQKAAQEQPVTTGDIPRTKNIRGHRGEDYSGAIDNQRRRAGDVPGTKHTRGHRKADVSPIFRTV